MIIAEIYGVERVVDDSAFKEGCWREPPAVVLSVPSASFPITTMIVEIGTIVAIPKISLFRLVRPLVFFAVINLMINVPHIG